MTDTPKRRPGRPKGLGKVPGSGRRRGTPNKHSAEMREYIAKHSGDIEFLCGIAAGKRFLAADPADPKTATGHRASPRAACLMLHS